MRFMRESMFICKPVPGHKKGIAPFIFLLRLQADMTSAGKNA
jgi:hypothetical protein